jgi:hypothetical protein
MVILLIALLSVASLQLNDDHGGTEPPVDRLENNAPLADAFAAPIRLVGRLDPSPGNNMYTDVWGVDHFALIGGRRSETLWFIDISNPAAPKLAGTYATGNHLAFVGDVQARGRIAYIASFQFDPAPATGVHIVDFSDPAKPVLLSRIGPETRGHRSVHNLFVSGDYLFTADHATPVVKVFNIANPRAPIFVRDLRTSDPDNIHDITIIADRLYTSGWGGFTEIYDVANIAERAPIRLARFNTGLASHSSWVTPDGKTLATASEYSLQDLRIYDISDLQRPALRATFTSRSLGVDGITPHIPVIHENLLFVSWYQAGLQVFDIRNPARPVRVGSCDTFPGGINTPGGNDSGSGIFDGCIGVYPFLGLDKVLVSDYDNGLFILDASALSARDSDSDGMPDTWESAHGFDPTDPSDAAADADGDGATNLQEFLSGTAPRNAENSVRLLRVQSAGSDVQVTFQAAPGRSHALQRAVQLNAPAWQTVADELVVHEGRATGVHRNAANGRWFYRVVVHP